MRYILYARKSSEEDERQVQSISDQQSVLRKLSAQLNLEITIELEEARSAKEPSTRPVFAQMVRLIQNGKADGILCWSINRLCRNPVDQGTIAWLLQNGVLQSIRTPDREYLPTDNVLLLAVEGGVATQYVIDLSKNVKRGLQEKALRGWWPFKAPPGYVNARQMENGIEIRFVQPDPSGFGLMRQAWELMLTGSYTVAEVRNQLDEWGFRTRKSKKFGGKCPSLATLYECFGNPFYYGWFRYKDELIPGNHEPMVTKDEFDQVQLVLNRNLAKPTNPHKHDFAFTGLIHCGACGRQITATRKIKHYPTTGRTREYVYYHCSSFNKCRKAIVPEPAIEERIRELLALCCLDKDYVRWSEQFLERHQQERPQMIIHMLESHKRRLEEAKSKLQRLYDMRVNEELSADEFKYQKNRVQQVIINFEEAVGRIQNSEAQRRETEKNFADFLAKAYERFTEGSIKNKREVAATLAQNYVLTNGRIQVRPHPLFASFLEIEPTKTDELQSKTGRKRSGIPTLCTRSERFRTLMEDPNVSFPQLITPFQPDPR